MPYAVAKNITYPHDDTYGRQQEFAVGGDIKYGVTSNLTLDGTVNPDFGQVESDPAILNLSNFETFLPEKRPFFVEGTGIFQFDIGCNNGACTGLFYSRRIGRQPQLSDGAAGSADQHHDPRRRQAHRPPERRPLRSASSTRSRHARTTQDGSTSEPATNYVATQFLQEFRDGQTTIGAMVTAVNRQLDATPRPGSARPPTAAASVFDHQFDDRKYELVAYGIGQLRQRQRQRDDRSRRRSSTHYFQRPGSGLAYDPTRTSLPGDAEKIAFSKNSRRRHALLDGTQPHLAGLRDQRPRLSRSSPASRSGATGSASSTTEPKSFYRQMYLNFNDTADWTHAGILRASTSPRRT